MHTLLLLYCKATNCTARAHETCVLQLYGCIFGLVAQLVLFRIAYGLLSIYTLEHSKQSLVQCSCILGAPALTGTVLKRGPGAASLRPSWSPVTLVVESLNCFWPPKLVIGSRQGGRVMLCLGPEPGSSPHTGPTLPGLASSMHSAWHIANTQ